MMYFLSYLPLLASFLTIAETAGIVTAKCPMPTRPAFLVKTNQKDAYPDNSKYTADSVSLPLKCVSVNFVLREPVSAKCVNNTWTTPDYECVALITLKRQVTDKIMIASGVVFGVTAAIFVIIKVVLYKRQQNKENKLRHEMPEMRGHPPGSVPWDSRPGSRTVYVNNAYEGYSDSGDLSSFQPHPSRLPHQFRGSSVYNELDYGEDRRTSYAESGMRL